MSTCSVKFVSFSDNLMSYWPPPTDFPFTRENSGYYQNEQYNVYNLNDSGGNSTVFYNQRFENVQSMPSSSQNLQFGASMTLNNQLPNGTYSNLTATAKEFTPSTSNPQNTNKKATNAYGRNNYGKNRSKYYNSRANNYDERHDRERDYRNRNSGNFRDSKRETYQSQSTEESLDSVVSGENGPDMSRKNRYDRDYRNRNRNSFKESKRETQLENSEVTFDYGVSMQNGPDMSRKSRYSGDDRRDREREYRNRGHNTFKTSNTENQLQNVEETLDFAVPVQNEVDSSRKNRNFGDERQDRERDYRNRNRTSFKTFKKDTQLPNVEESLDSLVLKQNESDSSRKNGNSAYDKGRFNRNGYVKYSGNSWSGKNNYGRKNNRDEGFDRNWRQTASANGAESLKNSGYAKGNASSSSSANIFKKKCK